MVWNLRYQFSIPQIPNQPVAMLTMHGNALRLCAAR